MPVAELRNTITLAVSVTDRHKSAEWYDKMLGFKLLYHADSVGWSELSTMTDGVTLGLGEQAEPSPGNSVPVFGVGDIDAARGALEAEGVRFDGETMVIDGMVKTASFYDPDGNALMLAEDLTQNG
ncbi:Glyoxalase family protein [Candidatus Rhodobacter oscarellae]|uniref:Glyoxalase family protein n=1 Tax=Candidatus Rhodobacter oscarellae TaxID=1675527 RepID=A0A0J9GRM5_9RHOB|nr:VOC family protein [Candidatus Rhodobacter lobularis]KMW56123.1 Glyoxalase family protein [Candidatus Rhodobacter lobularis]